MAWILKQSGGFFFLHPFCKVTEACSAVCFVWSWYAPNEPQRGHQSDLQIALQDDIKYYMLYK